LMPTLIFPIVSIPFVVVWSSEASLIRAMRRADREAPRTTLPVPHPLET